MCDASDTSHERVFVCYLSGVKQSYRKGGRERERTKSKGGDPCLNCVFTQSSREKERNENDDSHYDDGSDVAAAAAVVESFQRVF